MTSPLVSIVIVNYRQPLYTLDCLKSLASITYKNHELIVVDNNSGDESVQLISKHCPKAKLLTTEANLGFVGGNNLGISHSKGDYILILNNDTKVTPGFIEPLLEAFNRDMDLGIVQSKLKVMDQPDLLDNVVTYQTSTGFLFHEGYLQPDGPKYDHYLPSFSVKGACILIKREVLKLGAFDDQYFAYFEETDLCWRAWLMGFTVGFEPKSVIYHKMGATSHTMNNIFINFHSFKNRIRTILKNAQTSTLLYMLLIHIFLCMGIGLFFMLLGKVAAGWSIYRALWWNLINFGDTLSKRREIQSNRIVSDSQIFSKVLKNPSLQFYVHHLSLVKSNLT